MCDIKSKETKYYTIMIASDIHGDAVCTEKLTERFKKEGADKLLLLGDILYHGPRNDLPMGYNPKKVIKMLNDIKDDIICVRGNCDAEVDDMVLEFSVLAAHVFLVSGGKTFVALHGHHLSENIKNFKGCDGILCGHTHVSGVQNNDGILCINPGSVSIPKDGTPMGYIILKDGNFTWKDLDGIQYKTFSI